MKPMRIKRRIKRSLLTGQLKFKLMSTTATTVNFEEKKGF